MIFLSELRSSALKLAKGVFVVHLLLFLSIVIIQSCKKNSTVEKDNVANTFLSALKKNNPAISSISAQPIGSGFETTNSGESTYSSGKTVFLNFEELPVNPNYTYDINGMAYLVNNYHAVVSYEPSDNSYTFTIPETDVSNSLQPLIAESKAYLNARGFTNEDIALMIQEEGAQEEDLVPFTAALAQYESNGGTARINYLQLFGTSAYAQSVVDCAMIALGIDALWALGGSNASSWSKPAMKKAFKAVAKRALGPIGVAIAVVSFGLCMGGWH